MDSLIKKYQKQYQKENKVKIANQRKKYREENKEKIIKQKKQYYEENKMEIGMRNKQYYKKNKDKICKQTKQYQEKNREKITKRKKQYREENREQIKQYLEKNKDRINNYKKHYQNYKLLTNTQFKLSHYLRSRLRSSIRGHYKTGSAVKDLGCTISELKLYLEKQFVNGMSWGNYGKWHVDHKLPLKHFDLTDKNQFLKAVNYTNLQPLWASDNCSKGCKILENNI